jgi:hypothetical protein
VEQQPDDAPEAAGKTEQADKVFCLERQYYIGTFLLILLFIALILVAYLPLVFSYLVYGSVPAPAVRATIFLSGTYFFLLLFARLARREMDAVRFLVTPDSLVFKNSFAITTIAYADAIAFTGRKFPFIKGFAELRAPGRKITIPSTLRDFGGLVEALAAGLSAAGKAGLCTDEKMRRLKRIALVSEFSYARSRAAFSPLVFATIAAALAGAFIASEMWETAEFPLLIWMGLSLAVPIIIYGIADFRLNGQIDRQIRRSPLAVPRVSLRDEIVAASLTVALHYATIGILFKVLLLP